MMRNKNKLFAGLLLSASFGAATIFAQQTTPEAQPRIERQMQIFTNDDGSGYLGVQLQEINRDNFSKFGLRDVRGVAVEKVLENSPAARAGLQTGDVIVKFGGEEVTSARKIQRLIGEIAPDHQARITILRSGGERELNATIGKRPAPAFQQTALGQLYGLPGIPEFPSRLPQLNNPFPQNGITVPPSGDFQNYLMMRGGRQIGVGTSVLTKQLADYFGVEDGAGVLINSVAENSPASRAGLKAGDVITEADGKTVGTMADLVRAVNSKTEGDINLTIVRNRTRQTLRVTPEKRPNAGTTDLDNFFRGNGNVNQTPRQSAPQQDSVPRLSRRAAPRVM